MFFGFSRSETNAFMILLPLTGAVVIVPPMIHSWTVNHHHVSLADEHRLDSLVKTFQWADSTPKAVASPSTSITLHRFHFNPNRISVDSLKTLGLSASVAQRVNHYRLKGGRFEIKRDLLHIYGIDSSAYKQLAPFIDLPEKIDVTAKPVTQLPPRVITTFDLNLADSAQLVSLNGIGPALARRIIRYRDMLGGFVALTQLKEVYGLDTAVIRRITSRLVIPETFHPRQLNLNTASYSELSAHPYLSSALVKAIIAYRRQHGNFKSTEDLKQVQAVTNTAYEKIKPYLTVTP